MDRARQADVIVPAYRDAAMTLRCLRSVLTLSGPALRRLIVIDDRSPEPEMAPALRRLAEDDPRLLVLSNPTNLGFVGSCNRGLAEREGDAVLLNSDTLVTRGWLQELAEVAHLDDRASCVTPLSNNATICSVPRFCGETAADLVDEEEVRDACAGLPRVTEVPTGVGFCMYLRAEVLDRVGLLDPVFAPGYCEENDWSLRAQAAGFVALRANHAFVYHLGSVSFRGDKADLIRRNERLLTDRHPDYMPQVFHFCRTLDAPIAAHAVRVRQRGTLRVALDLRGHRPETAEGAYALQLADQLERSGEVELTVVVRRPEEGAGLPGRVVPEAELPEPARQFVDWDVEVVHRLAPVADPSDLPLLFAPPAHAVLTVTDPAEQRARALSPGRLAQRAAGQMALRAAQAVIVLSERSKAELVARHALPEESIRVTPPGVDHDAFRRPIEPGRLARGPSGLPGRYVLACAEGTPDEGLAHLLAAYALLRERWPGGGPPPTLALVGDEAVVPSAPGVVNLGAATPDRRRTLYWGADALVVTRPSDGSDPLILEAMAAGLPVVASPGPSIVEDALLRPDSGSPKGLARAIRRLFDHPSLRADLVERGRRRADDFHWERTARLTIDAYREAIFRPSERSLTARRQLLHALIAP